ncbi:MAG: hypothetical protein ACR2N0_15565 [Rubrobacteraceae bacterium]
MIESSVAHPTRTNTESPFVDRIEREIARLKAARPHLRTRVERAEHIIVTHLATANGTHRPVKVRAHADGSRSCAVRSCSKLRKAYTVRGSGFECDCPDARRKAGSRRHSACKHSIACYLLERAAMCRPSSKPSTCAGCSAPSGRLFEVVDSLTFFEGDMICGGCRDNTASEVA